MALGRHTQAHTHRGGAWRAEGELGLRHGGGKPGACQSGDDDDDNPCHPRASLQHADSQAVARLSDRKCQRAYPGRIMTMCAAHIVLAPRLPHQRQPCQHITVMPHTQAYTQAWSLHPVTPVARMAEMAGWAAGLVGRWPMGTVAALCIVVVCEAVGFVAAVRQARRRGRA